MKRRESLLCFAIVAPCVLSFTVTRSHLPGPSMLLSTSRPLFSDDLVDESPNPVLPAPSTVTTSRRNLFINAACSCLYSVLPYCAFADEEYSTIVTDKIFVDIVSPTTSTPDRIVIGLYGKAAPSSVEKIRQLVSATGLAAPCRPRAHRSLQKEQLEANKVYNVCMDGEDEGVSLKYSTIWRIQKDQGIDLGAVTGKFVAREYPTFAEDEGALELSHDSPGLVSVRRGNDSGFGFRIIPKANPSMDTEYIVVGRVIDGMDVVEKLNDIPVVNSASVVNYMALSGGPRANHAPDRSCRYGGPMYCNENKPLIKLKIADCGQL